MNKAACPKGQAASFCLGRYGRDKQFTHTPHIKSSSKIDLTEVMIVDKTEVISSGRQRKTTASVTKSENRRKFSSAWLVAVTGIVFCSVFLGGYLVRKAGDVSNYTFDTVYVAASADVSADGSDKSGSVLSGSIENGEWSLWAYLEYVISKLFAG